MSENKYKQGGKCGHTQETILRNPVYIVNGICRLKITDKSYCNVPVKEHRLESDKIKTE